METEGIWRYFPVLERVGAHLRETEIPYIQQQMATDCGAASLAMVLGLHGHHASLEDVRAVLRVTRDGVTARALVEAAEQFKLAARGVKVDIEDLEHLPRGSILHWEFKHFVVFDRLTKDKVFIVDPAVGRRHVPLAEARETLTGVAVVLEPLEELEKNAPPENVALRYMRAAFRGSQDWGRIAAVSLTIEGLTLLLPLITGRLIDRVVPRHDVHLLWVLVAACAGATVFYLLSALVRGRLLLHLKSRFDVRMTMSFVQHILGLPLEFFERRQPADLQLRIGSIQVVRDVLTGAVLSSVIDGTLVIAHLIFLAVLSPPMLGVALALVAAQAGLYLATRRRLRELAADVLAKQATASNALNEVLYGMEALKSAGLEQRAAQAWASDYVDVINISLQRGAVQATGDAVLTTLQASGPVLLLVMGIVQVMGPGGHTSLGTMLSANAMAIGFMSPTMSLIGNLQQLQQVRAQLMRVEDVINTEEEQTGPRVMAPRLTGRVELDQVSFRYGPSLPPALREISVSIRPGELVAIVGRSGSGKSTLGRLLLGLYQPAEGSIRFDGLPLSQLDLPSVRRQLGVVVQRAHVFGDTVRGNIALGDPTTPLDRVIQAAKRAHIHEDISRMPMGYDTVIVGGGASLSGGQRQRIALARALLSEPAMLLLDEATSALDAVTEHAVSTELASLSCTRVVIAHRLSTVIGADRILVMDNGRLVEQGTHRELLAQGGRYAELVRLQLGGGEAPAAPVVPIRRERRLRPVELERVAAARSSRADDDVTNVSGMPWES